MERIVRKKFRKKPLQLGRLIMRKTMTREIDRNIDLFLDTFKLLQCNSLVNRLNGESYFEFVGECVVFAPYRNTSEEIPLYRVRFEDGIAYYSSDYLPRKFFDYEPVNMAECH